jgi:hypothetical protein
MDDTTGSVPQGSSTGVQAGAGSKPTQNDPVLELIRAAGDLAGEFIHGSDLSDSRMVFCLRCLRGALGGNAIVHAEDCAVGFVLHAIMAARPVGAGASGGAPSAEDLDRVAEERALTCAHVEYLAGDNIVCTKCGVTLRKATVKQADGDPGVGRRTVCGAMRPADGIPRAEPVTCDLPMWHELDDPKALHTNHATALSWPTVQQREALVSGVTEVSALGAER